MIFHGYVSLPEGTTCSETSSMAMSGTGFLEVPTVYVRPICQA